MQARTKRWARRALAGTAAAVLVGAGVAVYLLQRPPAVWTEAQQMLAQTTPEERAEKTRAVFERLSAMVGDDVGSDVLNEVVPPQHLDPSHPSDRPDVLTPVVELSDKPVDQTHALKLTNQELIAVVSELFSEWTKQRGFDVPAQVTEPVVLADDGRLALAFEIATPNWQQVFSGYVDLAFRPDGMAVGRVEDLTAGSLPVSVTAVGEMLHKRLPESEAHLADRIGEWVGQLEGFEFRPVLEMDHRRRARVLAMAIGSDGVTLTMRVQDHETYKRHNALLKTGRVAVTDKLRTPALVPHAVADVPTPTD
ncbi:MAG: hypothetical protein ACE37H_00070 [Phycisphaeraceae bacterium]